MCGQGSWDISWDEGNTWSRDILLFSGKGLETRLRSLCVYLVLVIVSFRHLLPNQAELFDSDKRTALRRLNACFPRWGEWGGAVNLICCRIRAVVVDSVGIETAIACRVAVGFEGAAARCAPTE